jgi:hypothetical protein
MSGRESMIEVGEVVERCVYRRKQRIQVVCTVALRAVEEVSSL